MVGLSITLSSFIAEHVPQSIFVPGSAPHSWHEVSCNSANTSFTNARTSLFINVSMQINACRVLFIQSTNMNTLPVRMRFAKTREDAVIPSYAHKGDSGMDLITPEDIVLRPGVPTYVDVGVAIELLPGFEGHVRSRSGMTKEGITACGGLGTIDSTYRGSIGVTLTWALNVKTLLDVYASYTFDTYEEQNVAGFIYSLFKHTFTIKKGSKIAQLVVTPVIEVEAEVIEHAQMTTTSRGENGFGSTGR